MRQCRATLALGVLSVVASDLVNTHHADTDPAGDLRVSDILAAIHRLLVTADQWGELILLVHADGVGHVAVWGESITEVERAGACHWLWLQPAIDDVYESSWFTTPARTT